MAQTTWITYIKNDSNIPIQWGNGEHPEHKGFLKPGEEKHLDGTGFCFPWVDHTKDEMRKSIYFVNPENSNYIFRIFQSYNYDTIRWISGDNPIANHAVDVAGQSGAGGSKAIFIQNIRDPKDPYKVIAPVLTIPRKA